VGKHSVHEDDSWLREDGANAWANRRGRRRQGGNARLGRREAYFFFWGGAALASPAFGTSPISDLTGHTEKAGHFLQPATMAIGQSVMIRSFST
jgi:hypothetical protein